MGRLIALAVVGVLAAVLAGGWWLLRDPGPPPIAHGLSCANVRNCEKANAAFDAIIRRHFPTGTPATALEAALASEGFHRDTNQPRSCTSNSAKAPVGVLFIECPAWDASWNPHNSLSYEWGSFPCGSRAGVMWSTDHDGRVTHIEGYLNYACL
jgi:hypothetical protein